MRDESQYGKSSWDKSEIIDKLEEEENLECTPITLPHISILGRERGDDIPNHDGNPRYKVVDTRGEILLESFEFGDRGRETKRRRSRWCRGRHGVRD